jgi:hypothetical protein
MSEELIEIPVDENEPGSDEQMGENLETVQEQTDKLEHDEANEEALVGNTEPTDDGLPDAD